MAKLSKDGYLGDWEFEAGICIGRLTRPRQRSLSGMVEGGSRVI